MSDIFFASLNIGGTFSVLEQVPQKLSWRREAFAELFLKVPMLPDIAFRQFLEASTDGIIIINEKSIIQFTNEKVEAIFGYNKGELLTKNINVLMPSPYKELHNKYIRDYYKKNECTLEKVSRKVEALNKDNNKIMIELNVFRLSDKLFGAIIRDLQYMEESEKRHVREMEEKNMFAANISHELRTPLNSIICMTKFLINDINSIKEVVHAQIYEEMMDKLETIKYSGGHLLSQVNDILDYAKLSAGKTVLRNMQFSLRQCIESVREINCSIARDKGIEIVTVIDSNIPDYYVGDSERLAQVLMNIISNAIKFTESGSIKIFVMQYDAKLIGFDSSEHLSAPNTRRSSGGSKNRVSETTIGTHSTDAIIKKLEDAQPFNDRSESTEFRRNKRSNDDLSRKSEDSDLSDKELPDTMHLLFKIKDTGIGIDPHNKEIIFDAFQQADTSNTRKYTGTGLGLTICRKVCNLMNGDIWLDSSIPGGGSTFAFSVVLNTDKSYQIPKIAENIDMSVLANKRVLIVDDMPENLTKHSLFVAEWNMIPAQANSASMAIAYLKGGMQFDILLLDIRMPKISGVELAQQLRQANVDFPIIALSSVGLSPDDAVYFDSVIQKPVKQQRLLSHMYRALTISHEMSLIESSETPIPESDYKSSVLQIPSMSSPRNISSERSPGSEYKSESRSSYSKGTESKPTLSRSPEFKSEFEKAKSQKITELERAKLNNIKINSARPTNNTPILVAEDDKDNQKVIRNALKTYGYTDFTIVNNGQMVLDELKKKRYKIILMDIHMPIMDGLTATRKIKELYEDEAPKIIALTAYAQYGEREFYVEEEHMSDFISKPIDLDKFQKTMERHTRPKGFDSCNSKRSVSE